MNLQIAMLIRAAMEYDRGDPSRIQHLIKVHNFAAAIGRLEGLDEETQFILESAAVLHDIGIHLSEEKHSSTAGHFQELEGPAVAQEILDRLGGWTESQIERIKFLIGHHHTYVGVDGLDWRILLEADFLVNLYEWREDFAPILEKHPDVFQTPSGIHLLEVMFAQR